jgi:aspartate-semialdehyde dehydrogenase
MAYKVGILGATGAVGQEIIRLLHERQFPISELHLLASARSAGKIQSYGGSSWTIETACNESFDQLDLCIFSAGGDQSKRFAAEAAKRGCIVVDNSSAFRMDPNVPLVVPEINPDAVDAHKGILANPNCSTAISLMGLYPLHKAFGLKSFIASTYQAVSGSGAGGIIELEQQAKAWAEGGEMKQEIYPHQIAFNLIPHVDAFLEDGYTKEEMKMLNEGRKIMGLDALRVTCTCVRVPIFRAHSISISAEFEKPVSVAAARAAIEAFGGSELVDSPQDLQYPMPLDYSEVVPCGVGRIRKDTVFENGLALWVTGDQLWKGAALNAIQIAELLHQKQLIGAAFATE